MTTPVGGDGTVVPPGIAPSRRPAWLSRRPAWLSRRPAWPSLRSGWLSGPSVRLRDGGVRRQLTLATTALVLVTAVLGSIIVIEVLQVVLTLSSVSRAEAQVAAIAADTAANGPGRGDLEVPPGGVVTRIQIVDQADRVIASSLSSDRTPLATIRPPSGQTVVQGTTPFPTVGDDVAPIIVASSTAFQGTSYTVLLEQSQIDQHEAVVTVGKILLAALPFVLLAAWAASGALVGRALAPVDAMRRTVDTISFGNLGERVEIPAGRDEIGRLAWTMNSMLTRLESGQKEQQRFVSDASHELRSPLASLRSAVQVGERADQLDVWRHLTPVMALEADRLGQLINDLLTLSKAQEPTWLVARDDVDLDEVARCDVARLRSLATTRVAMSIEPVRVTGSEPHLARIVRNLTDNAARAARSEVRVTLGPVAEGMALLTVEDDGPGVRPEDRQRIFERFVRLDEDRARHSGGSGLGLAIAKELATAHDGTLRVTDSDLGGARFELLLPRQVDAPNR